MRLDESDVRERIEKVAKQVEEISELRTDIHPFTVNLVDRYKIMENLKERGVGNNNLERYASTYKWMGGYAPGIKGSLKHYDHIFVFPKDYNANEHFLNICIGHEILHNAQHLNFPIFWSKKNRHIRDGTIYGKAFQRLMEGDAEIIRNSLKKTYYQSAEIHVSKTILNLIPKELAEIKKDIYDKGYEIIKKEFGKNRKKINALYKLPESEILKIFGD